MTKKNENKKAVKTPKAVTSGETKVKCPVCGTEFAIGEHEHKEQNVTVIGADSGLGTVYLPVSKRAEVLKAAGVDTSKFMSIELPDGYFPADMPDGSRRIMKMDGGRAVTVDASDPVIANIIGGGTVPNRKLFRRWVMSQVFRWLQAPVTADWLTDHGYMYTWKMLIDELHAQTKMHKAGDMENFAARNRWFNKKLVFAMADDYIEQMKANAHSQKTRKCKGVPYIRVNGFPNGIFVTDIYRKMICPLYGVTGEMLSADTPEKLEDAARRFWRMAYGKEWNYNQCAAWKDAYKGAGAYFTMQNLLLFHSCKFPKKNDFYKRGLSDLQMLEMAAESYKQGCGWRLFGLMKQMISENKVDIEAKQIEWAKAKEAKAKH